MCSRQTARWIWAKAKRSTPDRFMPDGATLIRPTSGSRIGLCLMALRLSGLHLAQELVYA
ncbi:hypothetical protein SH89_003481 [Salmonella enterica subsp. enterica]|nr:hypothetical protein [Salmonella enterica subsp. enterica]EGI5574628.1 hypothetical protein [Salmonella enterica subsp. enterica serovar Telaviv]EEA7733059.1 hypothetical protein [Salmonella enterica subsp. enterica]EEA7837077.1 hypothetical protein [Salmonella enterica subsp. enterica]EEC0191943.1 hypothetical protein [Salmonella enterica subsp. enterica]